MHCEPLITVGIPTYNRCQLLERALSSTLRQDIDGLRIVVSDNGSTDGTKDYLKSLTDPRVVVLLAGQNQGMVTNWQRCLQHAKGRYFLLMSDDDALASDDALSKFVAGFSSPSSDAIGVVFSSVLLERPTEKFISRTKYNSKLANTEDFIVDFYNGKVSAFPCATMLRTSDLKQIGGYVGWGAEYGVDACVWISIALGYGKVKYIDEPLALYRMHNSLSSSSVNVAIQDLEAIQELLLKQRAQISTLGYERIMAAISGAKAKVPLGYIGKKWRNDSDYGLLEVVKDTLGYRNLIFQKDSLKFICARLYVTLKNVMRRSSDG